MAADKEVNFKDIGKILLEDRKGIIEKNKKWPLVVDPEGRAATFFRYRDVNYMNAVDPDDMVAEKIRRCLLGSLRYGKTFVVDMMESDMMETCVAKFDEIQKDLMSWILDKSITQEDKFSQLIRASDDADYQATRICEYNTSNFKFFVLVQSLPAKSPLYDRLFPVHIIM